MVIGFFSGTAGRPAVDAASTSVGNSAVLGRLPWELGGCYGRGTGRRGGGFYGGIRDGAFGAFAGYPGGSPRNATEQRIFADQRSTYSAHEWLSLTAIIVLAVLLIILFTFMRRSRRTGLSLFLKLTFIGALFELGAYIMTFVVRVQHQFVLARVGVNYLNCLAPSFFIAAITYAISTALGVPERRRAWAAGTWALCIIANILIICGTVIPATIPIGWLVLTGLCLQCVGGLLPVFLFHTFRAALAERITSKLFDPALDSAAIVLLSAESLVLLRIVYAIIEVTLTVHCVPIPLSLFWIFDPLVIGMALILLISAHIILLRTVSKSAVAPDPARDTDQHGLLGGGRDAMSGI